ncbi:MAG TPA: alkaline phosphatase family protein [Candidatus Krumholzibacteria bacterium]|nr:alkaline phosphatase family protein [Candidatus Krumholzibacteria bacterium]
MVRTRRGFHVLTLVTALLAILIAGSCQKRAAQHPKLIVLIAIDGLRADALDRYDSAFTGGFRRLRDTGFRFDNAWVDHAITVSHAGHVTLATGAYPSHHGIVDAAFYVPVGRDRKLVDAVEDTTTTIPGFPTLTGASPRNVLRDGICEWTIHADPEARTLSVGSGNISSLLYAFHTPADVYWYRGGQYVTSSYYRAAVPPWVAAFNDSVLPAMIDSSRRWECRVPTPLRSLARPDSANYEGDRTHTTFPHLVTRELGDGLRKDERATLARWFGWTPTLDEATLLLARRGVEAMSLGQRNATDCLTIVLSMVDSNSHYYGPMSLEVFDTLVRLDAALGAFFTDLDEKVGAGNYTVALSADHGFPEVPAYRRQIGLPGRVLTADEIENVMNEIGADSTRSTGLDSRARRVADILRRRDFVAAVYTPDQLSGTGDADAYLRLYRNSYRKDRVPRLPLFSLNTAESEIGRAGVMVRLTEGTMIDIDASTHGSPYDYDRHVPLVFMGAGVPHGASSAAARTIDVAPTLAALADVRAPEDVDGVVLPMK